MATTIYDLIEVTGIRPDTTYSTEAGNLIGVVDGVTSSDLDDSEFDVGDTIQIDGMTYTIDSIREPSSSGRFILEDGSNASFDPASESNLSVVFLTVSNGSDVRHFIIPNDSYGDMTIDGIRTGSITDVAASDAGVNSIRDNDVRVVCFVAGTRIATPAGEVPVEDIAVGDPVLTRDHGPQQVRMRLIRHLDFTTAPERLKPIAFERGSLGPGLPDRRLCVSPQHRMLVTDRTGGPVLVPAKALLGRKGVRVMTGKRGVTYIHLVFARHEIISANGTLTESFFPGPEALAALPSSRRGEITEIFGTPLLPAAPGHGRPAAPLLRFRDARRLALACQGAAPEPYFSLSVSRSCRTACLTGPV